MHSIERHVLAKIQARRKNLKVTQQEVADYIGVAALTYSSIENGYTAISLDLLYEIGKALDMSIVRMLRGYIPTEEDKRRSIVREKLFLGD